MIAKHESKSLRRFFNQLNPDGDRKELPNKTAGANRWGWGMCQIDKGQFGDSTSEVYDWHVNVQSMNMTLREKRNEYLAFIRLYRNAYGNNQNWVEPTGFSTNINGFAVSAETWGVLTLYNGKGGIPRQTIGISSNQRSPLEFKPDVGTWVFHTNRNDYVTKVIKDRSGAETE